MTIARVLTTCTFVWLAAVVPAGAADAVVQWNEIASTQVQAAARNPGGATDLAKMHLAIHDAVQAYFHNAEPYCIDIATGSGSPLAAVAKAARDVLVNQLPAAQDAAVETAYQTFLTANGLVGNAGIAVGAQAAGCIIALRAGDGSFPAAFEPFFGGMDPGEWRSTTTPPTAMSQSWMASVVPFAAKSSDQFRAEAGPPSLTSGLYTREYNEVKTLGAKTGTFLTKLARTPAQTELAHFYSDALPVLMQRTVRDVVNRYARDLSESARVFALVEVAVADAAISAWDTKIHFNFWRPITAIRLGGTDGNRQTDPDPEWEPLITTPNYPEFSSGANNLCSSAMRTLELFFRSDHLPFEVTSNAPLATIKTRLYDRFSDLCGDFIDVRIYQGIHFRTADEAAFRTGRRSADWAFSHILRPIH